MATSVTLPRLGQGMEAGTIVRWLQAGGDRGETGQALYEPDTEKVTRDGEADAGGVVLKSLAGEGEESEVGKRVAVIGEPGEDVPAEAAAPAVAPASDGHRAEPEAAPTAEPEPAVEARPSEPGG